MPELPEVEVFRQFLEEVALEERIIRVLVLDDGVLELPEGRFTQALVGRCFIETARVGKQLFIQLDLGGWVAMHFGMTGRLELCPEEFELPKHTRVAFQLGSGYFLAYICPRKLGRIKLTDDPGGYLNERGLGPDAMETSPAYFAERVGRSRSPIKSLLLDQQVMAGVGNWIADEALYQAGIHPLTPGNALGNAGAKKLLQVIQRVIRKAIELQANIPDFPNDWMLHTRWPQKSSGNVPKIELEQIKVGGRSTYFDPEKQKLKKAKDKPAPKAKSKTPSALKKTADPKEEKNSPTKEKASQGKKPSPKKKASTSQESAANPKKKTATKSKASPGKGKKSAATSGKKKASPKAKSKSSSSKSSSKKETPQRKSSPKKKAAAKSNGKATDKSEAQSSKAKGKSKGKSSTSKAASGAKKKKVVRQSPHKPVKGKGKS